MGEAKRRKMSGCDQPNPRYRKTRKVSNRQIERDAYGLAMNLMMHAMVRANRTPIFRK